MYYKNYIYLIIIDKLKIIYKFIFINDINDDYKFTLLHEAIHSILKKDMIECDKQNIKYRLRDF